MTKEMKITGMHESHALNLKSLFADTREMGYDRM